MIIGSKARYGSYNNVAGLAKGITMLWTSHMESVCSLFAAHNEVELTISRKYMTAYFPTLENLILIEVRGTLRRCI